MNVERIQNEVILLLENRGIEVDDNPLAEFVLADKNAHAALFTPESLPDGDLWFGAGCLYEIDDTEIFSVADDNDNLIALAIVTSDEAEVWMSEIGEWKLLEGW